jgi:hypothetical protein
LLLQLRLMKGAPFMKIRFASCTALVAVLALGSPAWAAKVKVCHVPPGNPSNFHTITVSENAVQAHLGHGDLLGECSANCGQLCDDGNACTVDACDASGSCAATHPPVSCDDGNLCTIDSCDPVSGCANPPKVCLDTDLCSVDTCDPLTGSCAFPPVACPAGQTCNANNGSCEGETTPEPCPCALIEDFVDILLDPETCALNGSDRAITLAKEPVPGEIFVAFSSSASAPQPRCGYTDFDGQEILVPATPAQAAGCIQLLQQTAANLGLTCN